MQDVVPCVMCLSESKACILVSRSFGVLDSPARLRPSSLVWSDVDNLVRGTWIPPYFVEKLLSGKQDQGDRELCVSLGGLAFVASRGVPERDLVAEK